jgi:hypothetical protein
MLPLLPSPATSCGSQDRLHAATRPVPHTPVGHRDERLHDRVRVDVPYTGAVPGDVALQPATERHPRHARQPGQGARGAAGGCVCMRAMHTPVYTRVVCLCMHLRSGTHVSAHARSKPSTRSHIRSLATSCNHTTTRPYTRTHVLTHTHTHTRTRPASCVQVLSAELDRVLRAMSVGSVPAAWRDASFPSLKPLASYTADLLQRLHMLQVAKQGGWGGWLVGGQLSGWLGCWWLCGLVTRGRMLDGWGGALCVHGAVCRLAGRQPPSQPLSKHLPTARQPLKNRRSRGTSTALRPCSGSAASSLRPPSPQPRCRLERGVF